MSHVFDKMNIYICAQVKHSTLAVVRRRIHMNSAAIVILYKLSEIKETALLIIYTTTRLKTMTTWLLRTGLLGQFQLRTGRKRWLRIVTQG